MTDAHQLLDAIRADDLAAVDALVAAGVNVNAGDAPHWPPLFSAIEHQHDEIVRRLSAAGGLTANEARLAVQASDDWATRGSYYFFSSSFFASCCSSACRSG